MASVLSPALIIQGLMRRHEDMAFKTLMGGVLCRLKGVCRKARVMAEAGAYLHWYEQYGFSRDDIDSCVEACLGVVGRYEQESAPPAPR